jgi:NodT family efflux transporter outer membrane factor (OMF) lipoprotein
MKHRFSLVLMSAPLLAGCTLGPNFERPNSPTSSSYVAADGHASSKGAPEADIGQGPGLAWWKAFGSPQLDTLVDTALRNNHSLAASNATLERARQRLAAVAGGRLPQVDATARAERQEVNLAGFGFDPAAFGSSGGNPVFNLYSVGGGVSYDLDLFGGKRRAVEQAAAQAAAQLHQTEAAHLTLAGRVVNQVLAIAAVRSRIVTANELIAGDQKTVDLTEARRRGGEGTLVEVLNVQSQLAQDRTQLPQLQQQLAEARDMLAVLLGISPADLGPTDFTLDSFTLPRDVPVTLPSELVHKRPDILQAEADLHTATAGLGVATARLYPDITLGATLTQGAPSLDNVLDAGFRGFDIFAGLTAPIFHGGTLKAEQRGAQAEVKIAAADYRQTVIEAFGQVADLLSSLGTDAQLVEQQQQALSVAERSRDLSRKSFQVGNSGILQVLDTSRQYDRLRSALVEARALQLRNVARLYVATAGGWTERTPDGDRPPA